MRPLRKAVGNPARGREWARGAREMGKPPVVDVHRGQRQPGHAGRDRPDDVHEPHRPGRADHRDPVAGPELAVGRCDRVTVDGRRARRADPAREVVVDPADVDRHGPPDPGPAQHEVEHAPRGQEFLELLDAIGIGAEVDDVVEGLVGQRGRIGDEGGRRKGGAGRDPDRRPLHVVRDGCRHVGGRARGQQRRQAVDRMARVRHDEQVAAGSEHPSLAGRVRSLDACPRLQQGDRGAARRLVDGDEEALARPGLDDHPLVEEDVLLEPALEVVAEGRVRPRGRQVPVVGLDQHPLADRVPRHARPDRHDPSRDLVAGDQGQLARHVARDLRERCPVDAARDLGLPEVRRERLEELRVGEADPDRLDLHDELGGTGQLHGLGPVVDQLAGPERPGSRAGSPAGRERAAGSGSPGVSSSRVGTWGADRTGRTLGAAAQLSITWPPVTGRAWPVS